MTVFDVEERQWPGLQHLAACRREEGTTSASLLHCSQAPRVVVLTVHELFVGFCTTEEEAKGTPLLQFTSMYASAAPAVFHALPISAHLPACGVHAIAVPHVAAAAAPATAAVCVVLLVVLALVVSLLQVPWPSAQAQPQQVANSSRTGAWWGRSPRPVRLAGQGQAGTRW